MSELGRALSIRHSISTFFGAPACVDLDDLSARIALLGVPYDYGTVVPRFRTGTSQGPDAVRRAPAYYYFDRTTGEPAAGWFDVEDEQEYLKGVTMADCGNVVMSAGETGLTRDRITEVVRRIVSRDALVVAVGGDHSISFPVGRGMDRYAPLDVVHFDAHADFSDESDGSRYTHGTQLRRLSELPFVGNITMVGLRRCSKQVYEEALGRGVRIVTARKLREEGIQTVVDAIRPARHLYVSIDTDVLDHPQMLGTTLPEPEGVSYSLLRQALAAVVSKGKVVGFDVVELSALNEPSGTSAWVTSWLITHFLSALMKG